MENKQQILDGIYQNIRTAVLSRKQPMCTGEQIQLVGVSKTRSIEEIQPFVDLGMNVLGENQVQEAKSKVDKISGAVWHLIGHLQTNKVKEAVKIFELIHSVDSERLLREIDKQAHKLDKVQKILLQINIAEEESKFGTSESDLEKLVQIAQVLDNVSLEGLMVIGPLTDDQTLIRSVFARGYRHFCELKPICDNFKYLSMGMSDDYPIALQEGANMVRIGSKIFGKRVYK